MSRTKAITSALVRRCWSAFKVRDILAALPAGAARPATDPTSPVVPAHEDQHAKPFRSAAATDGRWLLKCHAGCDVNVILDGRGLDARAISFPSNRDGQDTAEAHR